MMTINLNKSLVFVWIIICLFFVGCFSNEDQKCSDDSAISLEASICLIFEVGGEIGAQKNDITRIIRETVSKIRETLIIDNLAIRILADPTNVIPEIGIGGYNPNSREIIIWIDPNFNELAKSIDNELAPTIAHEIHHAKRRRSVGYGSSLLEACVSEGLADWYAIEIEGIDPPIWSVALTGVELMNWVEVAKDSWLDSPYDHEKWFFGTSQEIPRWTGYAIGFELVRNFLSQNPNRKASDLVNEPAVSFIP